MARIAGVDLPREKRIEIALTYIYGIGRNIADDIIEATGVKSGDKAFLIVNGSGATTLMEMLIVYRKAKAVLAAQGISVLPGRCTELLTVQEMAGFQMILCKCCDTCAKYLAAKSDAPYWTCLG